MRFAPRRCRAVAFAATTFAALFVRADEPHVVSPEVRPDRTVVFRLRAPLARSVTLHGEWGWGDGRPLARDASGVWSVTVGPLPANIYGYKLDVDGVPTTDPENAWVWGSPVWGQQSVVDVKGERPSPWDERADVP